MMLTFGNIADDHPGEELVAERGYMYGMVVSSDRVPDHKGPQQIYWSDYIQADKQHLD